MLKRIHVSDLGIDSCQRRARECLYWPRMSSEVKDYVQQCDVFRSAHSMQQKEPLQPHDVPSRPWAKVAVDLFHLNGQQYLLIVDYLSGFWEVEPLQSTLSSDVIKKIKMHFARNGIPDMVVSDNGPQFAAQEFQCFRKTWQFQLNSTSQYPKSNGKAENAVTAAKHLLKKAKKDKADVYLVLLAYRNTPPQGLDTSPAKGLMSRRTKTLLQTTANLLCPQITEDLHQKLLYNKERQAKYYNRGARTLARLNPVDTVRMYHGSNKTKDQELLKASVRSPVSTWSYEVVTKHGKTFRRNRVHLRKSTEQFSPKQSSSIANGAFSVPMQQKSGNKAITPAEPTACSSPAQTSRDDPLPLDPISNSSAQSPCITTRSGRPVKCPSHLKDFV